MTEKSVLKVDTAEDCLNAQTLPSTHDVQVDLYWCARGVCKNCSRKSENGCKKTEVGGCRHDLMDDANELLALLERLERNAR